MEITRTLKVRVKDKHIPLLRRMASEANFVWNYCNELSGRQIRERGKFMSAYDLDPYIKGAAAEFSHLNYSMISAVAHEYATKRTKAKLRQLKWRRSHGKDRSLGWVPFKTKTAHWRNGQVYCAGCYFNVWDSYGLSKYEFRAGCFAEDPRGRWYFCVCVKIDAEPGTGRDVIGVDLGLKDVATLSDGTKIGGQWFRALEPKLAKAQRAGNKKSVKAIHAKITNRRRDALHKASNQIARKSSAVYVGDVSSTAMIKTKNAKSAHDAGWYSFKRMLEYKCQQAGVLYKEINEAYTTQVCSSCGAIPDSSPKGRAGLGIREWVCDGCGVHHDRDVNAARNILTLGLGSEPLAEENAEAA